MNTGSYRADMYTKQPTKLSENAESSAKNPSTKEKARTQRFVRFLPAQEGLNIRGEQ